MPVYTDTDWTSKLTNSGLNQIIYGYGNNKDTDRRLQSFFIYKYT